MSTFEQRRSDPELLGELVRRVTLLESKLKDLPKHTEVESIVSRSTDHAADRILIALRPMLMASQQQQQQQYQQQHQQQLSLPERAQSPRSRRGSNADLRDLDLNRLGASWLQYEAQEAAQEASFKSGASALAAADAGRSDSDSDARSDPGDTRQATDPKPRRSSATAEGRRRPSIGEPGKQTRRRGSLMAVISSAREKVAPLSLALSPSPAISPTTAVAGVAPPILSEPKPRGQTGSGDSTRKNSKDATVCCTKPKAGEAGGSEPPVPPGGMVASQMPRDTPGSGKLRLDEADGAAGALAVSMRQQMMPAAEAGKEPPAKARDDGSGAPGAPAAATEAAAPSADKPATAERSRCALVLPEATEYHRKRVSLEEPETATKEGAEVGAARGAARGLVRAATFAGSNALTRKDVVSTSPTARAAALDSLSSRRWILLPTSRGRRVWDQLMLLVALLSSLLAPLQLAFWSDVRSSAVRCVLGLGINLVWVAHLAVNFRTGFEKEGVIVTAPRAVALRYVRTSFAFDLLCCWPDEFALLGAGLALAEPSDRAEHLRAAVFYLQLLKAFCVLVLVRCFQTQETLGSMNPGALRLTRVLMILGLTCHWGGCLWWLIAELQGPGVVMGADNYWIPHEWRALLLPGAAPGALSAAPLGSKYVHAFFWGVSLVSGITVMEFEPVTDLEMAYTALCVLSGLGIYCYVLSSATAAVTRIDGRDSGHRDQLEQIDRFLRFKKVSERVRTRIADYLDFIHSTASTDGLDFMRMLPVTLQAQLSLALNMNCLTRVPILQRCTAGADSSVMVALVMKLTTSIHLPQDVVLHQGESCSSLGFINRGMLEAVRDAGGAQETVVQVLRDNEFWGQAMLVIDRRAQVSVRSISYSDVMSLSRHDAAAALQSAGAANPLEQLGPELHMLTDFVSGDLGDLDLRSMAKGSRRLGPASDSGAGWARLRGRVKGAAQRAPPRIGSSPTAPSGPLEYKEDRAPSCPGSPCLATARRKSFGTKKESDAPEDKFGLMRVSEASPSVVAEGGGAGAEGGAGAAAE